MSAEICEACGKKVYATEKYSVDERGYKKIFHKQCMKCTACNFRLPPGEHFIQDSKLYCKNHAPKAQQVATSPAKALEKNSSAAANARFGGGDRCTSCGGTVYAAEKVFLNERLEKKIYHRHCIKCSVCQSVKDTGDIIIRDGVLYCKVHNNPQGPPALAKSFSLSSFEGMAPKAVSAAPASPAPAADERAGVRSTLADAPPLLRSSSGAKIIKIEQEKCFKCGKTVYPLEKLTVDFNTIGRKTMHKNCFRCNYCNSLVSLENYVLQDGKIYCKPHVKLAGQEGRTFSVDAVASATSAQDNVEAAVERLRLQDNRGDALPTSSDSAEFSGIDAALTNLVSIGTPKPLTNYVSSDYKPEERAPLNLFSSPKVSRAAAAPTPASPAMARAASSDGSAAGLSPSSSAAPAVSNAAPEAPATGADEPEVNEDAAADAMSDKVMAQWNKRFERRLDKVGSSKSVAPGSPSQVRMAKSGSGGSPAPSPQVARKAVESPVLSPKAERKEEDVPAGSAETTAVAAADPPKSAEEAAPALAAAPPAVPVETASEAALSAGDASAAQAKVDADKAAADAADAEAKAKAEAEAEGQAKAKADEEAKAKADAEEAKARAEAEAAAEAKAKEEAEARAKEDAEAKAKEEAAAKAKADAEAREKDEAEAKAKAEADENAKQLAADAQAKAEAEAKAKAEAEARAAVEVTNTGDKKLKKQKSKKDKKPKKNKKSKA